MSNKITQNTSSLQDILEAVNSLPNTGGSNPILQDKTVSPTTSQQTIKADSGYDGLDTVTVNAMPTATQATPSITINASGLITATATQTAGYVAAGTKSATKQLAFQPAKTITPTTTSQTAVSSGYYTSGDITIEGDSNLVAGNIKSGVSIFGVNGTYEGSGGSSGDTSMEDGLITRTTSNYTNNRVTAIGSNAFYAYSNLTTVSFPNATTIGSYAFQNCSNLTTISFPNATTIGSYAFQSCSALTSMNFPNVTTIGNVAFGNCKFLTVDFPKATTIGTYAFNGCNSLTSISFPNIITIGISAFSGCVILTTADFPKATTIRSSAFVYCYKLTTASFPNATIIENGAFFSCSRLTSLYLTGSSVCKLSASRAFNSTPIGGYSATAGTYGSIFVPASLVSAYRTATNWTYFSSRITAYLETEPT